MTAEDERRANGGSARALTVAFTGSASFLGQNLIGLLEEDPRIRRIVSMDIATPATAAAKTIHHDVDLTRPRSAEHIAEILGEAGADVLVHLAFLASPSHATAWAHELESLGTMHVLTGASGANVKRLVLWSHTLLYGAHPTNPNFLTEKHPLRARRSVPFFADKIEAEEEAARWASRGGGKLTVLRTAPILGPTVRNFLTRYLAQRLVPTLMGFDPLFQFLHEVDALAAFKLAILRETPGTFNIAGDGVLPLSTVIKLAGRAAVPLPGPLVSRALSAMWMASSASVPPHFLDYLRFVCVADTEKAAREMGFRATYGSRDALLDFAGAQRLRDVRLLSDHAALDRKEGR